MKSDKTPAKYREKIDSDLGKAVALRDEHGYDIKEWFFVTPEPLSLELRTYVTAKANAARFEKGVNLSDKRLQDRKRTLQDNYPPERKRSSGYASIKRRLI